MIRFRRLMRFGGIALVSAVVIAGFAVVAGCGGDDDDDDTAANATPMATAGDLSIYDGWVRTTTNDVSAAYFMVKNAGLDDTLVKVTSSITDMAQLHEVITEGANSKMQEKEGGFPVPAKGELMLQPGGYHVMLMNLKEPLKAGETVELELQFEKAGTVKVTVPVKASGDSGMEGMDMSSPTATK
ncbi:MAG: copper chaperone PCu(A)C [Dehalococcoidia bacterium]